MKYKKTIDKANNYVLDNLFDDIFLEDVAKVCAYSPFHFHKIYKSSTGLNVGRFTRIMKLKHALYLLIQKDLNVTQTSQEVGFYTPSSFSVAFKDQYDCSPAFIKKSFEDCVDKDKKRDGICCEGNHCDILNLYYQRMENEKLENFFHNLSIIYDETNNPKILTELSLIYPLIKIEKR